MANIAEVERGTGYVLGGVSPLGKKKQLNTVIDQSAKSFETIYISAGRRGLELELSPHDLQKLTVGLFLPIATR
jgi:Cys-tRNA(Pro)/Cys-tRNA(Cys) deacylase